MEYKPLVVNTDTSFAVHITDLQGFKAVKEGTLALVFKGDQGDRVFKVAAPATPGIFRPVAKLPHAGRYHLTVTYSGAFEDTYEIGEVEVYPDSTSIPQAGSEEEGRNRISFLKEQQWKGGFNVEEAQEKELFEILHVQGQVRALLKQAEKLTSPAAGKLIETSSGFPLLGSAVLKDQIVAEIRTEGDGKIIPVKSPISGVVSVVHAAPGASVEEGRPLLDLIDTDRVWVEARVYEPDISKLNQTISAIVEVPDTSTTIESSRLVSIGGALDTVSRTTPVVFELENQQGTLKIGVNVRVNIRIRRCGKGTVVPVSAIIDEDGKTVAYVQVGGEAFERRDVKLCIREGNLVQVVDGIQPGERVVTEGAYSLRLMSVSSQIPAHGHAH
jgi:biotin carboxyl carrier protein